MSKPLALQNPVRPKLTAPPIPLPTKPPKVNRLNYLICFQNRLTLVLEFSPQYVQLAKQNYPPNLSTKVEELIRQLGQLR